MTRERRLAIEMWEEIAEELEHETVENPCYPTNTKRRFCSHHKLKWSNNCWFCQYVKNCDECPIGVNFGNKVGCLDSSPYATIILGSSREARVEATRKIVLALKGKWHVSRTD